MSFIPLGRVHYKFRLTNLAMLQLLHLHDQLPADSAAFLLVLLPSLFLARVQYAPIALQIKRISGMGPRQRK